MTKLPYLFALFCVLFLQLCSIIHAQGTIPDLESNYETEGNEEWDECEMESNWENEECYWDEEYDIDDTSVDDILNAPATVGKAVGCETEYTVQQGEYCDLIATNNGLSLDDFLALNQGLDCNNLQIGAVVCVKATSGGTNPPPDDGGSTTPSSGGASGCGSQYTVQQGEYCDLIATNNGLSLDEFLALNQGLDCNNLQIGAVVCVGGSSGGDTPPPDDGGSTTPSDGGASGCESQYKVQQGEYCDLIATNNGLSLDDFLALNQGLDCNNLQVGAVVCVKGSSGGGTTPPDDGGNTPPSDVNISFEQFTAAVTATNGYPAPTEEQYNSFINNFATAGGITTTRELAMFLAEILWESGGLQFKSEIRCQTDSCPNDYRSPGDDPSKFYYGRGYIQLTWSYNYKAASEDLFGDDRLVQDPDQVATNEDVAWQTAFWFWKTNVHGDPGVQNGQFGSATNKINGALECNPCQGNCSKRNEIYAAVLQAFGVNEEPNTAGC